LNNLPTQISAEILDADHINQDNVSTCEEKSEKKEMQEMISMTT